MNKLILATAAFVLGTSALTASAQTFEFDPDQNGIFIDTNVLTTSMFPNTPIPVTQSFGADGLLNNGDVFSESFQYNNSNSTGTPSALFPLNGLTFDMSLTGKIANVAYGAGVPDALDAGGTAVQQATFADNLSQTSFETIFNTSIQDPTAGLTISWMGGVIGEFDLVKQINTVGISLDGTTVNQAFIFDFQFDQTWAAGNMATINAVWRQDGGSLIDATSFTIQGQGSAGPNGSTSGAGVDANGFYVIIDVQDNGSTFKSKIPEPSSIAILGLGLLGLAGARRKGRKA